jgi:hypothetical protein
MSAVITASPTACVAVTRPELLTRTANVFELRQTRLGMLVADFVVPSAWRMFATNWTDWPSKSTSGPITSMAANGLGSGLDGASGDGSPPQPDRNPMAVIAKRQD